MKRRQYFILFILNLSLLLLVIQFQDVPGYMDADYYYATGVQLAEGKGFTQNFIWNYLDEPQGLPHYSHTYWMPLPSLLTAAGIVLWGSANFQLSRFFFVVLAGFFPLLVSFGYEKLFKRSEGAFIAGLFAVFPGFYVIYLTLTDTFMPTLLLGFAYFLVAFSEFFQKKKGKVQILKYSILGIISGLFHMTRADGLLWLAATILLLGIEIFNEYSIKKKCIERQVIFDFLPFIFLIAGYLVVTTPWYMRNLNTFHMIFPPGNSKALWLVDYNQTFVYPASELSFESWLEAGMKTNLTIRVNSLLANLKTVLAVQGEVFLFPFILLGLWELRAKPIIKFVSIFWLALLLFMSFVFPFAGSRGGFLHSGIAFQSIFWMAGSVGLFKFISFGSKRRGWKNTEATLVFSSGFVIIAASMTVILFYSRVIGEDFQSPIWDFSWNRYKNVEQYLIEKADKDDVVMVNNPPGYESANNRGAVVIPYADLDTILQVAKRYDVSYLILDENYVPALRELYLQPQNTKGLTFLVVIDQIAVYEFNDP